MISSKGQSDQAVIEPPSRVTKPQGRAANASQQPHLPRRHRWLRISLGAIVTIVAITVYSRWHAGEQRGSGKGAVPPVMISTATASTGEIGVYVQALGTVTPLNTVSLTARVAGQISKVEYQEGQLVHAGDPLVEIDPAPFQAAVTQAEGQLARDQAQLELAKVNLVRETDLLNKKVVSKQEYDTQVATDHQSEGAVKLDQGNLDMARVN